MIRAYYINLNGRTERRELMMKTWQDIVNLRRIPGVEIPAEEFGAKGCFQAHKNAFSESSMSNELSLIMEDDIMPTSNFEQKLQDVLRELPNDWCILMVGFNTNDQSEFLKINDKIAKAKKYIMAGHCYIVNPKFYRTFYQELRNPSHGENFDSLLINLQQEHSIYMCVPTLCYQYSSYSDNSKSIMHNTESTKKYFSE